jgi:hypothetical protein
MKNKTGVNPNEKPIEEEKEVEVSNVELEDKDADDTEDNEENDEELDYEPEDCEDCKQECEDANVEYEKNYHVVDGTPYCDNCERSL